MKERPIRRFRLAHATNIRDIGGYETEDGQVTKFGCLLRGSGLHRLTESEWKRLTDYGVRTVLDLRSLAEIEINRDQVPEGVEWYYCPLLRNQLENDNISESAAKAFKGSLTEGYESILKNNGDLLTTALKQLIAGLEKGAVLFHCSAGKDRTGVLASTVLYLCGVSEEDIVADYEVTYTYNSRVMEPLLSSLDAESADKMRPYLYSNRENMENQVKRYQEIGLAQYLFQHGLTEAELLRLKELFLF